MAGDDASATTHAQTCKLHDNQRRGICTGTLKKGGSCVNRVTASITPGFMPTCRVHEEQRRVAGWCKASLPCGFECGLLFEWKPHGFHLCPSHSNYVMTMREDFLSIPMELRLRIYGFLLPDLPIPAKFTSTSFLTTDRQGVYIAILRVNRQIHDEAVGLLYGTRAFSIELLQEKTIMCNFTRIIRPHLISPPQGGNHALQDYQMQLMLLEQQNKQRLMHVRHQYVHYGGPSSNPTDPVRQLPGIQLLSRQLPGKTPMRYEFEATPVWDNPINDNYFNMIRYFRIEIRFPAPVQRLTNHNAPHGPVSPGQKSEALELKIYEYCDLLHKLIRRLMLCENNIAHVEILIEFSNAVNSYNEAFNATSLLLQPFRRLLNVDKLTLLSITLLDPIGREVELLEADSIFLQADATFSAYIHNWPGALSGSQSLLTYNKISEVYWKLENLVKTIKENYQYSEPRFSPFSSLLHTARMAREADNIAVLKNVWDEVANIWFDHCKTQEDFQVSVAGSISAIYDSLNTDP